MAELLLLASLIGYFLSEIATIDWRGVTGTVGMVCFWCLFFGLFDQFRKTMKAGRTGIAKIDLQFLVSRWCLWGAFAVACDPFDEITFYSRVPGIPILLLLLSQEHNPRPKLREVLWTLLKGSVLVLLYTAALWFVRDALVNVAKVIEIVVFGVILPFGLISTYKNYRKYVRETTEAASLLFVVVRFSAFANMAVYYGLSERYLASLLYVVLTGGQLVIVSLFFRPKAKGG